MAERSPYILPLAGDPGSLVIEAHSGAEGKLQAFSGRVEFRDHARLLIPPPYPGLRWEAVGAPRFDIAGGSADCPAVTRHDLVPPKDSAYLYLEIRRKAARSSATILTPPRFEAAEPGIGARTLTLPMTPDVTAVTLRTVSGGAEVKKAFLAAVVFRDIFGDPLEPRAGNFPHSDRWGHFFYVTGGSHDAVGRTRREFLPPDGAATLELRITSWHGDQSQPFRLASVPEVERGTLPSASHGSPSWFAAAPTPGTRILNELKAQGVRVVGIFGAELLELLGSLAVDGALPFDRYEASWLSVRPTHLVIEVIELRGRAGWEEALSLRNPSATRELSRMFLAARAGGITTMVVAPPAAMAYRFPYLSSVAELADLWADDVAAASRMLLETPPL